MAKKSTISVTGVGVANGSPDQCRIYISLNHMASTAAEALTVTGDLAAKAIGVLGNTKAEQCEVRTTGLSVQDFFDQAQQKVTAHVGSYQLEVIIRPIDAAGVVLSALSSAIGDGLQIRGITLSLDDPEPLRSESRRLALEDAKTKAAEIAAEMRMELGKIITIQDQQAVGLGGYVQTTARAAIPLSGQVPIEAGPVSASSTVTLIYALGG
ncbi:MAG TPA: SIMPL domain-containing protein [Acidimicrobiales bacterium]|nr:SIMPL domain-containing protein [Acidimicrobiales bacterium]